MVVSIYAVCNNIRALTTLGQVTSRACCLEAISWRTPMNISRTGLWIVALMLVHLGPAYAKYYQTDRGDVYAYSTTVEKFERGFSEYYEYHETDCKLQKDLYGVNRVCYHLDKKHELYIHEQQIRTGEHRVTVYSDQDFSRRYAEYDILEREGQKRRVVRREFHESYEYIDMDRVYYDPHWDPAIWNSINWESGWGKMAAGGLLILQGVDIAAEADGQGIDSDIDLAVGALFGAVGLGVAAWGAVQLAQESRLEKAIERAAKQTEGHGKLWHFFHPEENPGGDPNAVTP